MWQYGQLHVQHRQAGGFRGPVQGATSGAAEGVLHVGVLLCDLRRDDVDPESLIKASRTAPTDRSFGFVPRLFPA